ncbi:hypothetical protein ZWY2020_036735 [Hordeum vulgare]|nr:hypothetical protein ZWY2020_036735 [Hordeum vulgare]
MERKAKKHARTRSGALASFLRSTAASFSSSTRTTFASRPAGGGGKSSFNHRNAFSGPMVSIVPPEARGGGRRRGGKQGGSGSGYRTPEASSPKVSCIGQIKRSKSKTSKSKARKAPGVAPGLAAACGMDGGACPMPPRPAPAHRPKSSLVKRMFSRRSRSRPSASSSSHKASGAADLFKGRPGSSAAVAAAPVSGPGMAGLGQMKRFTSGRGAFQDFDWRDAERRGSDVDHDYEDDGFVAFSAPLVLGGGVVASEPRKEVNLWRRRPMSPPTPLELP